MAHELKIYLLFIYLFFKMDTKKMCPIAIRTLTIRSARFYVTGLRNCRNITVILHTFSAEKLSFVVLFVALAILCPILQLFKLLTFSDSLLNSERHLARCPENLNYKCIYLISSLIILSS